MADVYEQNLGQKSSLTTSDFIRVVGSDNVSYKQPVEDVLYAGGVRYKAFATGTAFSDFADSCNIGITFSYTRYPSQSSDSPTSITARCAITVCRAYSDEITMSVTIFGNATENIIYERRKFGTWGSWVQLPTRAEIDALKSKFITTECRGNSSFDLPIENDKHYLITMMTSSATSARAILISRRDTFVELVELGAGSWQSYFTETLSNNTWHITCSYYTIIKIVVL